MSFRSAFPRRLRQGAALLLLSLCTLAQAGDDWEHHRKLSLDTSESGSPIKEDVVGLPLLVRLHSGNFTFSEAKPDGSDLRFFAADGKTPLAFHIDTFDAANELAAVWVQLPKLGGSAKSEPVVMAWGNKNAAAAGTPAKTYDASQLLVLHFGGADGVLDSGPQGLRAQASTAQPLAAGPIGAGAHFDGNGSISFAAAPALKLGAASGFTLSFWIKPTANDNGTVFAQRDGGRSLVVALRNGTLTASAGGPAVSATAALKPAIWQHVAVVAAGGKLNFYVDGADAGSGGFSVPDLAGAVQIGEGLHADLDELGLSGTARPAGYVQALAASQGADSPLLSLSEEGAAADSGGSVFSILMGAVTLDGWIVIALLMVMAVVSFYVMISKAFILAAIGKSNQLFLAAFEKESQDLLTPGHAAVERLNADARLQRSPIYRLYALGLQELRVRFDAQALAARDPALNAASTDAIRAALDAASLKETQSLNRGIVLLTIAIAGGPFLGLLGTVVGVMITFAAIAAAGDVNVNAIAPGIAAALVATVAGLAVAIPALFGYNWLAAQIKNASSDIHVFVDRFLTRSAEVYSA